MTEREALKLALEALEASHFLIHGSETKGGLAFCMDGYYSGCFDIDSNDKQTNEAITAVKEALEQQGRVTYVGNGTSGFSEGERPTGFFIQSDKRQPEPEYLAFMDTPQRTWVGLTNEELTDLFYNTNLGQQSAVGQAIELLRERNT